MNLKEEVEKCKLCGLYKTRNKIVLGEGNMKSKVMFVAEAPGETNDKMGRPFVGYTGSLFNNILKKCGLKREEIFVTNVMKCWTQNRTPKKGEIEKCMRYLNKEIKMVNPEIIIALGKVASESLTNKKINLKVNHGKVEYQGKIRIIPTFHPNSIRYMKNGLSQIVNDIKKNIGKNG